MERHRLLAWQDMRGTTDLYRGGGCSCPATHHRLRLNTSKLWLNVQIALSTNCPRKMSITQHSQAHSLWFCCCLAWAVTPRTSQGHRDNEHVFVTVNAEGPGQGKVEQVPKLWTTGNVQLDQD